MVQVGRGATERLVKCAEDAALLPDLLFCVFMDFYYVDAESTLKRLGIQSELQLVGTHTADLQRLHRLYSTKSVISGLFSILCTKGLVLQESKPHLLRIIVSLQKRLGKQREEGESVCRFEYTGCANFGQVDEIE